MSRKKRRYKDLRPKPTMEKPDVAPEDMVEEDEQKITRYKAVVRSPIGEWWNDNKKRVRLFALVGGGGLVIGWILFEFFSLIF